MTTSSKEGYVLPSTEAESMRLEAQGARLFGGTDFLEPFLATRPGRILDVGCGTGIFARFVAEQLPDAEVVGIDVDDGRLGYGLSQGGPPSLELRRGGVEAIPFDDDRFDLVFCRFLLVHVPEPERAIAEMARVAAPGGFVVAYEMVHDGIWFSPEKPAFAETLRTVIAIMRARGLEPSEGLHLASGMARAGLGDLRVEVVPHSCLGGEPIFEDYARNWVGVLGGLYEELGALLDEELVEQALVELVETTPEDLLVELTVLASGTKG